MSEEKSLKTRNWGALDKRATHRTVMPHLILAWIALAFSGMAVFVSIVIAIGATLWWLAVAASAAVIIISMRDMGIYYARKQRDKVLHGPSDREKRWALKYTAIPYGLAIFGAFAGSVFLIAGLMFSVVSPGFVCGSYVVAGALILPPYAGAAAIGYCREEIEKVEAYLRGKAELERKTEGQG